ncbi:glycosyltransferase family 4 protein [Candidatus Shapirobacteria bacterium]|nr:glycosyltransferase family 4 protein [Candidatus Shapirobacteria bacterium]
MIIGIDGFEANQKIRVGSGQYAFNLLTSLQKIDHSNIYHIYLKDQPLTDMPPESTNWHYHVFGPKKMWTRFALPLRLLLNPDKIKLFYTPTHYGPSFSFIPYIPTIHDIGYLQTPEQFTKKDYYQLKLWTSQSIRQASQIIAVSNFTKNELIKTFASPQRISIIENGVGDAPSINKTTQETILKKFNLASPYFLSLGTLKPNKNYPFIIEGFAKFLSLSPKYQLVIAGKKGWLFDDIFKTVQQLGIEKQVIFTDYITETEKWALLSNAFVTVIPSLYEGFGIPALESQKVGVPVIASQIPSYQEVLGNSALLVDPTNTQSLTESLVKICHKDTRQKIIDAGFANVKRYSWDKSAQKLIEVFSQFSAV